MIDGSEKRNRQLAFELQNSHVCEKRSKHNVWKISQACMFVYILLVTFRVKNIVSFCVKKLLHFALKSYYISRQKLLYFGLMLHFASKVVTFRVDATFYVNCYILRRNRCYDVIKLRSQSSEALRILIYTRLKINK